MKRNQIRVKVDFQFAETRVLKVVENITKFLESNFKNPDNNKTKSFLEKE